MQETIDFIINDLTTAIKMNQADKQYRFDVNVMKFTWLGPISDKEWEPAAATVKEVLDGILW
ncbi:MAG: hypothetical protein ACLU4J_15695 [Butyricimonas paravirosa]